MTSYDRVSFVNHQEPRLVRFNRMPLALVLACAVVLAACGGGSSTATDNTVKVEMTDNKYEPTSVSVRRGETVTFEFTNDGKLVHEAFIGDDAEQESHAMEMSGSSTGSSDATMDMGHGGGHGGSGDEMLTLDPGKSGSLTHTFDSSGTVIIGCHQPGHYEGGMKATVTVA